MAGTLTFNNVSSATHGVYISGQGTYNAPQRDVTKVTIPGRNGDLIRDNGRWLNIQVPYNLVVMDNFRDKTDAIRAWLTSPVGYARLEDSYHPDHYRMARVSGTIDFDTSAFNRTGKTTVYFDCKPQRFLKSGETATTVSKNSNINNPTSFPSKPLIRVNVNGTGSGSVTIGSYTISLSGVSQYVMIDCEIQDCYKGTASANNQVTLSNGFPVLNPGNNSVTWSGVVSGVQITGRWFTL